MDQQLHYSSSRIMNTTYRTLVLTLLTVIVFIMGTIFEQSRQKTKQEGTRHENPIPEQDYSTTGTSKSLFADGQAYFSADKSPGKISVKPLSIFQKMITETCKELNLRITSITPLGPGVMINGEMCYGAIHITHAPISTFTGKKGSL